MGHCGYLAIAQGLLIDMVLTPSVHKRIISMYSAIRTLCNSAYRSDVKKNAPYYIVHGMTRMYMSAHFHEDRLATSEEVAKFIDVTYANMWDIELLLTLDRDSLVDIIIMIMIVHRVYVIIGFFKNPLEISLSRAIDSSELPLILKAMNTGSVQYKTWINIEDQHIDNTNIIPLTHEAIFELLNDRPDLRQTLTDDHNVSMLDD